MSEALLLVILLGTALTAVLGDRLAGSCIERFPEHGEGGA